MKVLVSLVALCVSTGLGAPQSQGPRGSSGGSSDSSSNAAAAKITRLLGSIYSELGDRANGLSPCVFPFTHKGVIHNACTTDDDFYGMYWCSTRVDSNGVHAFKEWRHCQQSDTLEGGIEVTKPTLCERAEGTCQAPTADCNGKRRKALCGDTEQDCCIENPLSCTLNGTVYQNGDYNDDTCLRVICINGHWEFTGKWREDCGDCKVDGDPHVYMFDKTSFLPPPTDKYRFGGTGIYNITQNGLSNPEFGVSATFVECNTEYKTGLSCIQSVRYYEPGLTMDLILPEIQSNVWPPFCSNMYAIDEPTCQIKVKVNGKPAHLTTGSVRIFTSTNGGVLAFNHNHIKGDKSNLLCMNLVGTQGLSVSVCEYQGDSAHLYVLPMPTLRKKYDNELYGLCNTYTGIKQDAFTVPSGAKTTNVTLFGDQWKVKCETIGGKCLNGGETCSGVRRGDIKCGGFSGLFCCAPRIETSGTDNDFLGIQGFEGTLPIPCSPAQLAEVTAECAIKYALNPWEIPICIAQACLD